MHAGPTLTPSSQPTQSSNPFAAAAATTQPAALLPAVATAAGALVGNLLQALAPGLARQVAAAAQPPVTPGGAGQVGQGGQALPSHAAGAPGQATAPATTAVPQGVAAAPGTAALPQAAQATQLPAGPAIPSQGLPGQPAQLQAGPSIHNQALPGQPAQAPQQNAAQAMAGARGEALAMPVPGTSAQPSSMVPGNPAMNAAARADGAMAPPGAPAATATTTTAAGAPGATQAATAIVLTQAAVPASQSPGDAKGVTLLAGGEQRAHARVDGVAHGHTITGTQRRPRLTLGLGGLIAALGMRNSAATERHRAELEQQRLVERMFQWLYWVLAITAYGCLGMAILVLLPVFDADVTSVALPSPAAWVGGFATLGLVAGLGAWLLARRLR